jgi:large subunit ribosomal protein L10
MSKAMKSAIVDQMVRTFEKHDSAVVLSTGKMTVADTETLRARLRSEKIRLFFVKNSLASVAFEKVGFKGAGEILKGPSAVAVGSEGAASISKIVVDEAKKKKNLEIVGAYFEGKVLDKAAVEALSKMPGKKELQAMVLQAFFGPVSDFSRSLDGLLTEVHGLIESLEKKAGAAAAAPA